MNQEVTQDASANTPKIIPPIAKPGFFSFRDKIIYPKSTETIQNGIQINLTKGKLLTTKAIAPAINETLGICTLVLT